MIEKPLVAAKMLINADGVFRVRVNIVNVIGGGELVKLNNIMKMHGI